MTGKPPEIPHPLNDPNYRDQRSLYLNDWATLVQPNYAKAENMVTHSVTYGSAALNASYLINGGALAAMPAFLTIFTDAQAADIAWAAAPFVIAILCTAVSSTSAYLNFQFLAKMYWHDADYQAAILRQFYETSKVGTPSAEDRKEWEQKTNISFVIGLGAALFALGFFLWGAWGFFVLATHAGAK